MVRLVSGLRPAGISARVLGSGLLTASRPGRASTRGTRDDERRSSGGDAAMTAGAAQAADTASGRHRQGGRRLAHAKRAERAGHPPSAQRARFPLFRRGRQAARRPRGPARIKALVIPPAWEDVWICPREDGHIQAVGTDVAGRRQYRYHDRWRDQQDREKFDRMLEFGRALPRIRTTSESTCAGANCPGSACWRRPYG